MARKIKITKVSKVTQLRDYDDSNSEKKVYNYSKPANVIQDGDKIIINSPGSTYEEVAFKYSDIDAATITLLGGAADLDAVMDQLASGDFFI